MATRKKKSKEHRGGHRDGSGRKKRFNEDTTVISFRVPESKESEIRATVNEKLAAIEDANNSESNP